MSFPPVLPPPKSTVGTPPISGPRTTPPPTRSRRSGARLCVRAILLALVAALTLVTVVMPFLLEEPTPLDVTTRPLIVLVIGTAVVGYGAFLLVSDLVRRRR